METRSPLVAALLLVLCAVAAIAHKDPEIRFTENSSTGIYVSDDGWPIRYFLRGRDVSREDFREWLKVQDAKQRAPFCPFFPEFCGEPI